MRNKIILFTIMSLIITCKTSKNSITKEQPSECIYFNYRPYCTCEDYLSEISEFWIRDSIGVNAFRTLITSDIIQHCNSFKGKKWKDIQPYFGNYNMILPNSIPMIVGYYTMSWNEHPKRLRSILLFYIDKNDSIVNVKNTRWNCDGCD